MVEVNFRIFFRKNETGLLPDYHRHMALMQDELSGKVEIYLDRTEAMPVYQYYSVFPLGYLETSYLRRMRIGKSVMYIKEGIRKYADEYRKSRNLPFLFQRIFLRYLKIYLNSLDYIVVEDKSIEETLKREGVCKPEFCEIPAQNGRQKEESAKRWMDLYQKMAVS